MADAAPTPTGDQSASLQSKNAGAHLAAGHEAPSRPGRLRRTITGKLICQAVTNLHQPYLTVGRSLKEKVFQLVKRRPKRRAWADQ